MLSDAGICRLDQERTVLSDAGICRLDQDWTVLWTSEMPEPEGSIKYYDRHINSLEEKMAE